MAEHYKRYFIKFSRFLAMKCFRIFSVSFLTEFDWNLMFSTVQFFVVLLWFMKMYSYFGFFFWSFFFFPSFFSLWAPKGVTYRAFVGGCYKWKFSNHSISFVTWAKWCVHGRGFLGKTWSVVEICHCERELPPWFALISINIYYLVSGRCNIDILKFWNRRVRNNLT